MAFSGDWVQDNGVVLNYHRVVSVDQSFTTMKTTVGVASYVSKGYADKAPIRTMSYVFDGLVPSGQDTVAWAEAQLIASNTPRFASAKSDSEPDFVVAALTAAKP